MLHNGSSPQTACYIVHNLLPLPPSPQGVTMGNFGLWDAQQDQEQSDSYLKTSGGRRVDFHVAQRLPMNGLDRSLWALGSSGQLWV